LFGRREGALPILLAKIAVDEVACAVRRLRTRRAGSAQWPRICTWPRRPLRSGALEKDVEAPHAETGG
jgi:hypothetical protein